MSAKKLPPELRRHPHTLIDISLLDLAEQLGLLPRSMDRDALSPWTWAGMAPAELRSAKAHARAVRRRRDRWAAILVSASPPTARNPDLLITARRMRALLHLLPGEARIWRRGEVYHPAGGRDRRWGWFEIRQPGLFWAFDLVARPAPLVSPISL
jgi:hypothetical protein